MKKLDGYSIMIVGKYFETQDDFINVMAVSKKFRELCDRYHFNPISLTQKTLHLFVRLQTLYLYTKLDDFLQGVNNYVICYRVDYKEYLDIKGKHLHKNLKFLHIEFSMYDDQLPFDSSNEVNQVGYYAFSWCVDNRVELKKNIKMLSPRSFSDSGIKELLIHSNINFLPVSCFKNCCLLSKIELPNTIGEIKSFCFSNCVALRTIDIPEGVSSIGMCAFKECISLSQIQIPKTLNTLNERVLFHCASLTCVTLPSALTRIKTGCFSGCSNLRKIVFNHNNKIEFAVPLWMKEVFEGNGFVVQNVKYTKDDRILNGNLVPLGVTAVEKYCFAGMPSLTKVVFPETVTKIGKGCFAYTDYLQSVVFPSSLVILGKNCFTEKVRSLWYW
ncbi:hypothetical protein EIN_086580 [Entamoeba invadens IP1]|uniref:hypothetical protein n=1 Tax=Entamoeba invadens IP1 TaxID=370355 RepID=UPI0002C3D413|nr:hypothetical protein EIN_086580 [Entamoeba invadens IP1]ELP85376.1 hypothetical protein EIN_086580 [Entamoeba invadens IP1]|eukprot:XP_004184722.1 hypothetical protein EIN_086580 [Entamoeba invadens IP1]